MNNHLEFYLYYSLVSGYSSLFAITLTSNDMIAHFCKTFCKFLASTQETDANERPCIDGYGGSRGGGEHNSRAE